jgi:hypothetical protein
VFVFKTISWSVMMNKKMLSDSSDFGQDHCQTAFSRRYRGSDFERIGFLLIWMMLMFFMIPGGILATEGDARWYPKSQGEMKAMLIVLAQQQNDSGERMKSNYLQRLKTYRYVCGVPFEDLAWDDEYASLTHHASLVCSQLNKLTHTPEKPAGMSEQEYALGKRGAGESNLFSGRTEPVTCVDGWMDDSDPSNIDRVGHRRWCLNPRMLKSAFGTVGKYAAMYAFDGSNKSVPEWDYVAYPARGYMPIDLFSGHHAWSVSPNMSKFVRPAKDEIHAIIQPVDEKFTKVGAPLPLDYFNVENGGFGSGTAIIFRPEAFSVKADTRYKVEITGLKTKDGKPAELMYLVHFVDMRKAPDSADGRRIVVTFLRKRLDAIQVLSDRIDKLYSLTAFSEEELVRSVEPSLVKEAKDWISELIKDPALRKEQDAAKKYPIITDMEKKAGTNKKTLVSVALTYRDFSNAFKGTRAGLKASSDFERMKKDLE